MLFRRARVPARLFVDAERRAVEAAAAAACAALALWFHPIVLPSVGVLALASIA